MLAKDVMTKSVISVAPETHVREVAKSLLENRISAVPVVDASGRLLGIVSEGDLMRRSETGTQRHSNWWLALFRNPDEKAIDYIKSHGVHAGDVMTKDVVTIEDDTELARIADILERHRIKRVPVLSKERLVGIVSRADLLRGLASMPAAKGGDRKTDRELREAVEKSISETGADTQLVRVIVNDGVVSLWGATETGAAKQAAKVAAETVPGIRGVEDRINILRRSVRAFMWAE